MKRVLRIKISALTDRSDHNKSLFLPKLVLEGNGQARGMLRSRSRLGSSPLIGHGSGQRLLGQGAPWGAHSGMVFCLQESGWRLSSSQARCCLVVCTDAAGGWSICSRVYFAFS